MVAAIQKLSKPAVHYKIFAAGRKNPHDAFAFTVRHLRPGDGVCIGVYPEHKTNMLLEDAEMFVKYVRG